jgi:hypothetical protein
MSLHDAWARITPLEMLFSSSDAAQDFLATVAEEAEGRGAMPEIPHSFITMATTSDFIASIAGEGAPDAEIQRVSALAYHVVNFHRLEGRLYFLDTAVSRYLTGGVPGAAAPLPSRAGYVQLPQHLFWLENGESVPESVDGIFWTVTGDGVLHSLVVTNVRPDGTGAGVVPLPEAPVASAAEWLDVDARGDGADFATALPGGDLDQLYGLSSSGEVLKLLARLFAYLHAVPDAAATGSVPAEAETPRPTALPHLLVRLRA